MNMNIKRQSIVCTILLIALFCFIIIFLIIFYKTSPKYLYNNSLNSVFELKAETTDIGESFGSCVLIEYNKEKLIITNAHVISYKKSNENILFDSFYLRSAYNTEYEILELIKYDYTLDIAILKLKEENSNYKPIKIKDFEKVKTGETVYAIGNMNNNGISITKGIISNKLINIKYEEIVRELIQVDITISSGNSGGALIDNKGKLIGLTSLRLKDDNGNIIYGIGYVIPMYKVIEFINNK